MSLASEKAIGEERRLLRPSEPMGARTAIGIIASTFLVAVGLVLIYVAGNIVFSSSEGAIFQWQIAVPGIALMIVGTLMFLWVLRRHNLEVRKEV